MKDYRYLKTFMTVAKHLSFSKASAELHVATSAVGRQIKLLEEELKADLFLRTSKQVFLTNVGVELLRICEHFEEEWEEVFLNQTIKTIKIGIVEGVLDYWFRPLIKEYYKKYRHNLEIIVGDMSYLKSLLSRGLCDFAFLTEEIQTETLTSLVLFSEKFYLIGPETISQEVEKHREELQKYRWIVYSDDDPLFFYAHKKSPCYVKVNSMSSMIHLVEDGLGVAIIPRHIYESYLRSREKKKESSLKMKIVPISLKQKSFIYLVMGNYKFFPFHLNEILLLIKNYASQTSLLEKKGS